MENCDYEFLETSVLVLCNDLKSCAGKPFRGVWTILNKELNMTFKIIQLHNGVH
jgi:hypothetical protein